MVSKLPEPAWFDALLAQASVSFMRVGGKGVIEEISPNFVEMFGLKNTPKTFVEWLDALEGGARAGCEATYKTAADAREIPQQLLFQHQTQYFEASFRALDSGQMFVTVRDVTAARKELARLQQENALIKQDLKTMGNLLNTLPMPIWLRKSDMSLKFCNLAYMEAAELSPDATPDAGKMELYRAAPLLAQKALREKKSVTERRHFVLEGERKWYQFMEIPSGDGAFLAGLAQDITEVETQREELERHVSAQSALLESTASAMAIFGTDKRLKFYNNAYMHLWKLEEKWLSSQPTYKEILERLREDRKLPEQVNFVVFRNDHLKLFTDLLEPHEEFFYLPDGRTLRLLAIPHAQGGLLFAYEDVTDRLALERSYNTLIAVQRATLDHLQEGVVVVGEDGRIKLANPEFLRMWILQPEILKDEPHMADLLETHKHLYVFDDWESFKAARLGRLEHRAMQQFRIDRTDGRVFDAVSVPLPDGGTLISYSDVTDSTLLERSLRDRNQALQEADRLKTEFLANVSYELRSPLTSISGFAEMLENEYFGALNDKQREYVSAISNASKTLSMMIDDILDVASIEAGVMQLDFYPVAVDYLLEKSIEPLQDDAQAAGVTLEWMVEAGLDEMSVDQKRLIQCLSNLMHQILKHVGAGGKLLLSAQLHRPLRRGRDDVQIIMEEMPAEGTQGSNGAERLQDLSYQRYGSSLGISMVKSFIQLHGGRMEVAQNQQGGLKIICTLPRMVTDDALATVS